MWPWWFKGRDGGFCERQNERMLYFPDGRILDRCYLGTKMPREIQEDSRIVVTQWARVTVAVGWFFSCDFSARKGCVFFFVSIWWQQWPRKTVSSKISCGHTGPRDPTGPKDPTPSENGFMEPKYQKRFVSVIVHPFIIILWRQGEPGSLGRPS